MITETPDEAREMGRNFRVMGMPMLMNPFLNFKDQQDQSKAFDRGYMDEDTALRSGIETTERVTA